MRERLEKVVKEMLDTRFEATKTDVNDYVNILLEIYEDYELES